MLREPTILGLFVATLLLQTATLVGQSKTTFGTYRGTSVLYNPAEPELDYLTLGYNVTAAAAVSGASTETNERARGYHARVSYLDDRRDYRRVRMLARAQYVDDRTGRSGHQTASVGFGTLLTRRPERSGLSLAVSGSYFSYLAEGSRLLISPASDQPVQIANFSESSVQFGLGAYYYRRISRRTLLHSGLALSQTAAPVLTRVNRETTLAYTPRILASAGYVHTYSELSFLAINSALRYSTLTPARAELNLRYQTASSPYLGVGMTTAGQVNMTTGLTLLPPYNQDAMLRVGYAFEYDFNARGPRDVGTHQLQLNLSLDY